MHLKNTYGVRYKGTKTAIWTKINPSRKILYSVTVVGGYPREKFEGGAPEEEYVAYGSPGSPDKKQGDASYPSILPKGSKFPPPEGKRSLIGEPRGRP